MATTANPHHILFTTGPSEPIWRTLSSAVHLIGVSVLAYCIACRSNSLCIRHWGQFTFARRLVLLIFIDSWLFLFSTGILIAGVGLTFNLQSCSAGIFLCIALYVTTKLLIYMFLVEKVHIVNQSYSRLKSRPYQLCMLFVFGYFAIIVLMVLGRIAFLRNGHQPASVNDTATDGACVIGLQPTASLSLLIYDLILNVFFTCMFLYPIYTSRNLKPRLRLIAKRTLIAAFIALLTSVVNICVLTVLHGKELGAICLGSCGLDTTVNALAIFAVTSPIDDDKDDNKRDPAPGDETRQRANIIGGPPSVGGGLPARRGGGGGGILLETAAEKLPEYKSSNTTRSVHFSPEVDRLENRSGGGGIGALTMVKGVDVPPKSLSSSDVVEEKEEVLMAKNSRRGRGRGRERDLERGWTGMGIEEDVIQPGIMDLDLYPFEGPAGGGSPASSSGSGSGSGSGTLRNGGDAVTSLPLPSPLHLPPPSIRRSTNLPNRKSVPYASPALESSSRAVARQRQQQQLYYCPQQQEQEQDRSRGRRPSSSSVDVFVGTVSTSSSSVRPGTPEETVVEIRHEGPAPLSPLKGFTTTLLRTLSLSAVAAVKTKDGAGAGAGASVGHDDDDDGHEKKRGTEEEPVEVAPVEMKGTSLTRSPSGILASLQATTATRMKNGGVSSSEGARDLESLDEVMTAIEMKGSGSGSGNSNSSSSASVLIPGNVRQHQTRSLPSQTTTASTELETLQERQNAMSSGAGGEGLALSSSSSSSTMTRHQGSLRLSRALDFEKVVGRMMREPPSAKVLEVEVTMQTDQRIEKVRRKRKSESGLMIEDYSCSFDGSLRSRSSTGGL